MGNLCCVPQTHSTPITSTSTYVANPTPALRKTTTTPIYVINPVPMALNNPQIKNNFQVLNNRRDERFLNHQVHNDPGRQIPRKVVFPEHQEKATFPEQQEDQAQKIHSLLRRLEELRELLRTVHSALERNKMQADIDRLNHQVQNITSKSVTSGVTLSKRTSSSEISTAQNFSNTKRTSAPEVYNPPYTSSNVLPALSRQSSGVNLSRRTSSSRISAPEVYNSPYTSSNVLPALSRQSSGVNLSRRTSSSRISAPEVYNPPYTSSNVLPALSRQSSGVNLSRRTSSSRISTAQNFSNTKRTSAPEVYNSLYTSSNVLPVLSRQSSGVTLSKRTSSSKALSGAAV